MTLGILALEKNVSKMWSRYELARARGYDGEYVQLQGLGGSQPITLNRKAVGKEVREEQKSGLKFRKKPTAGILFLFIMRLTMCHRCL